MNSSFTLVFIAALTVTLSVRLWLAKRQINHVLAHRSKVPTLFQERIALPAHQKAAEYTVAKTRFGMINALADAALLLALTLGGGLAALHQFWSPRLDGLWYGVALVFSVMAVSSLVELPFSIYQQFVLEERFGFNRMTLRIFLSDLIKQILLGAMIGTPTILAVLWLMGAMGQHWWIYVWIFWLAVNLLILFIFPTWIAPMFNKFSPLEDGEMKSRIEALLQRCGFQSKGLFVMDSSKRSSHGNAYFTGFGRSKRIVFFDTLLSRLEPSEIEAVLAHELGHFSHRHVVKRIVLMFGMSFAGLWILGQLIDSPWFYTGLGVPAQNTALALVLFFLIVPIFTFPASPLMSLLSRRHEFEADAYAARHASIDDLARALVKLYEDNAATLTPDPIHSLVYDSHPPAVERIGQLRLLQAQSASCA